MARSVLGRPRKRPTGIIARHQSWQLSPGLKHGHVESIDQLAQYHTQFNTPTEWRRQFCSGETRFDRYTVNAEWLAFRFGEAVMPSGATVFSCSHRFRPHTLVSRPPRV